MDPIPFDVLARRVARIVGADVVEFRAVSGGWTAATRVVAILDDGSTVFIKAATTTEIAEWLRTEHLVYGRLSARFMPSLVGWHDDASLPILVLEDLSAADWPPPWSPAKVSRVLDVLDEVHSTSPPEGLPLLEDLRDELHGWTVVARDPDPFLALGLCSARWLERALHRLSEASCAATLAGDDLVHYDVRSDNICFQGGRTMLIDWNGACVGNGVFDVAGWLPSLHLEGGPSPLEILPDEPELAALLSGYWASRAGLPPPWPGSRVREVQLDQLESALPWAAEALGLPPPDGA